MERMQGCESVYKRDSDRKIFTVRFVIANIKPKIERRRLSNYHARTMKTATLLVFLLLELACTYGKSLKSVVFHAMNRCSSFLYTFSFCTFLL